MNKKKYHEYVVHWLKFMWLLLCMLIICVQSVRAATLTIFVEHLIISSWVVVVCGKTKIRNSHIQSFWRKKQLNIVEERYDHYSFWSDQNFNANDWQVVQSLVKVKYLCHFYECSVQFFFKKAINFVAEFFSSYFSIVCNKNVNVLSFFFSIELERNWKHITQ